MICRFQKPDQIETTIDLEDRIIIITMTVGSRTIVAKLYNNQKTALTILLFLC